MLSGGSKLLLSLMHVHNLLCAEAADAAEADEAAADADAVAEALLVSHTCWGTSGWLDGWYSDTLALWHQLT